MGVILRSPADGGRRRISEGGSTQKILRGVYPELVEGLRMTWMVLPVLVPATRIAQFRENVSFLLFVPPDRTLSVMARFIQQTIAFSFFP